jgi:hypothetical protein
MLSLTAAAAATVFQEAKALAQAQVSGQGRDIGSRRGRGGGIRCN